MEPTTTIQVSRENRERLAAFGKAGESLNDALSTALATAEAGRCDTLIDKVDAMSDRDLAEMVEYGQARNYPCVLSPAWDKDNVGDLRDDILTSISDGWDWSCLVRDFRL